MSTPAYFRPEAMKALARHIGKKECVELFGDRKNVARYIAKRLIRNSNAVGFYPQTSDLVHLQVFGVRFASQLNSTAPFAGDDFIEKLKQYYETRVSIITGLADSSAAMAFFEDRDFVIQKENITDAHRSLVEELNAFIVGALGSFSLYYIINEAGRQENTGTNTGVY